MAILPQRNGPAVRPLRQRVWFAVAAPVFDTEPALRSSFSFSTPAIDMSEDEKAYKISAELPGIDAKDVDVSVSGDMLVLKGTRIFPHNLRPIPTGPEPRSLGRRRRPPTHIGATLCGHVVECRGLQMKAIRNTFE
jgi:hypothetical protein